MKRGFCVFLCAIYRLFSALFHPVRVIGRENMVREGPVILCANHVSLQDPMGAGRVSGQADSLYGEEGAV